MRIALVQQHATSNKADNVDRGLAAVDRAAESGAELVCFAELAFEQEMALERRRRDQLRKRAVNRSRARRISRNESRGKVRFSVLLVCLTITVVTVVVAMFETLAWLMS